VDKHGLRGILFSSAGALAVAFGGVITLQSCFEPPLAPLYLSGSGCTLSNGVADSAYFLGAVGGALAAIGVWEAGIGRKRVRAEGGGLVVAIGAVISALGFSISNVVHFGSAFPMTATEIGLSLGVVGSIILVFGALKLRVQATGLSDQRALGPLSNPHWSPGEWAAAGLLVSILVVATLFLGLALTTTSSGNFCGSFGATPCSGPERLSLESQTLNSPTNVTLEIRNMGSVAISLVAYYVKDTPGQQYSNTSWSGPTIVPNALTPIAVTIDGSSFTFQTGNDYTVTVITARNNQFTFAILG